MGGCLLELAKNDALAPDSGQVAVLILHIHVLHAILCCNVILYLIHLYLKSQIGAFELTT